MTLFLKIKRNENVKMASKADFFGMTVGGTLDCERLDTCLNV